MRPTRLLIPPCSVVLLATLSLLYSANPATAQQQKRIYIAADDHTDLMWTADIPSYTQALTDMLDYYLDLTDSTMSNAPPYQSRFACDATYWLWVYERNRTRAQFDRAINRLRDGHLSAPLTMGVSTFGATPAEAVLRGMYYAGQLERRYTLRFPMAMAMENQGLPYGLGSLFAGAGAKYSWRGICNCNTSTPNAATRDHDIYWWTGPDGSRLLMKWNSLLHDSRQLGGYAESLFTDQSVEDATSYIGTAKWPYNVIGSFGRGWDFLETKTSDFVNSAINKTDSTRQVITSNEVDFFQDFEATYGSSLPSVAASFGNDWELNTASLSEVSASVKRAVERLRVAEAMETLVALKSPGFPDSRAAARDQAYQDLGNFWEHNWTANGNISKADRAAWQRSLAAEIAAYVNSLAGDSAAALGGLIANGGAGNPRFFAFNPLGHSRTDVADFPYGGPTPAHVLDVAAGTEVPSQIVTAGGTQKIRILAGNVPGVGYKVFEIVPGQGASFPPAATVNGGVLENSHYKVTVASAGAITSLIDKTRGNLELIQQVNGRYANDLGGGSGTLAVENAGPVSVTLLATAGTPLSHTSRITLFSGGIDRVDIVNEITQNFTNLQTWGFGFNISVPDTYHEEVGAVILAKQLSENGQYAQDHARYDWLTLNHFADMVSEGNNPVGVTLSNADLNFFQMGASAITNLDDVTPSLNPLAGGQTDPPLGIPNQGGDSDFLQRFALRAHDAFDPVAAMRFALEHQNPLATGAVTGTGFSGVAASYPADTYSLVTISNPSALLWALKPAEEGINAGIVARLWNLTGAPAPFTLSLPAPIGSAKQTTHVETDIADANLQNGALAATLGAKQIQTFRLLLPAPPSGALKFYTVTPCRLFDTRNDTPIISGETRTFQVTGSCGIPPAAMSVTGNVTVVYPTASGYFKGFAAGTTAPPTSIISFNANQVRANNALLTLGPSGQLNLAPILAGAYEHVDVVLDVNGYFQ